MIRIEVVEEDVPWLIVWDWMEEEGMVIGMGKMEKMITFKVDAQKHMSFELRKRKREQEWWESRWIKYRERLKRGVRKLHL